MQEAVASPLATPLARPWLVRRFLPAALFLTLLLAPLFGLLGPERYVLSLFARCMIFAIAAIGLDLALGFGGLVNHTRIGMLVRAGASNAPMVSALGVDIGRLFTGIFAFGAMLAAFAGALVGPIVAIEPNMGDNLLILAFVVIIIGGIGSVRGAFLAALIVGLVDTLGRSFASDVLRSFLSPSSANQAGPALASMLIYVLMAGVLFFRPAGLFPARR